MTDRTIIQAVERVIAKIQADRDFWSRYNQAPSYYQLTASPEDAMIIQTVLEDWLYGVKNSSSDERKGEGWSTISVDENVGSNRGLARPSLTINLVLKDDSSVPIVKEALSNFDDRRIDELTNYIKAMIMLTKE